jgi:hypothetical protein
MSRPFVKVDRTHTVVQGYSVRLRLRTFRARLELDEFDDILGVKVIHLRSVPSDLFTTIEEYDIIIPGSEDRCRLVQDAILQALQGNREERNLLVFHANSMF